MEKLHILLVDDCEITLQIASLTLESSGYTVSTLASPHFLVRAIREKEPDLLLLDVHMPGLRGDRVVPILKGHRFSKDLPVLLFSDSSPKDLQRRVKASGADGFVRKTEDPQDLAERLREALDEYRRNVSATTES